MSDKSKIEWTDATWNAVVGCSPVSAGCANCYAIRSTYRVAECQGDSPTGRKYAELTVVQGNGRRGWSGNVEFFEDRLLHPLKWRKPRKVFVNSQSDLWHPDVDDQTIDRIFAVMALAKDHTFQVLTKRPERMLKYLRWEGETRNRAGSVRAEADHILAQNPAIHKQVGRMARLFDWPLKNVWLGVSVEDQKTADDRIPFLVRCPAAVRYLSCEPLLGPISLFQWLSNPTSAALDYGRVPALLDWVIVGGESGPLARSMNPDWPRSLRDQCQAANVAFFFKQHGEWISDSDGNIGAYGDRAVADYCAAVAGRPGPRAHIWPRTPPTEEVPYEHCNISVRVGKRASGRLLDGVEWSQFPPSVL